MSKDSGRENKLFISGKLDKVHIARRAIERQGLRESRTFLEPSHDQLLSIDIFFFTYLNATHHKQKQESILNDIRSRAVTVLVDRQIGKRELLP